MIPRNRWMPRSTAMSARSATLHENHPFLNCALLFAQGMQDWPRNVRPRIRELFASRILLQSFHNGRLLGWIPLRNHTKQIRGSLVSVDWLQTILLWFFLRNLCSSSAFNFPTSSATSQSLRYSPDSLSRDRGRTGGAMQVAESDNGRHGFSMQFEKLRPVNGVFQWKKHSWYRRRKSLCNYEGGLIIERRSPCDGFATQPTIGFNSL